ncbi:hypothetical protein Droror1_Dr00024671 [Drosera rotundifolia]
MFVRAWRSVRVEISSGCSLVSVEIPSSLRFHWRPRWWGGEACSALVLCLIKASSHSSDSVVRAIEKVMRSGMGKTMRKNVMFLKEHAKEAAKVDGSSDRNLNH